MHCDTCGTKNVTVENGVCSGCKNQSQRKKRTHKETRTQKPLKASKKKKPKLKSKPKKENSETEANEEIEGWTTYEAFNIILKKQVAALIQLGASFQLQDVVLQLWACYLCQIDVAFVHSDDERTKSPSLIPRNRDFHINVLKKTTLTSRRVALRPKLKRCMYKIPVRKRSPSISKRRKTAKVKKRYNECSSDDEYMPLIQMQINIIEKQIADESLFEEEEEERNELKKINYKKQLQELKYLSERRQGQLSISASKKVNYMNMIKTVGFCYLGILLLKENILLSDIKRWIKDGSFPYFDVSNLLPPYMKFQKQDYLTFMQIGPPSLKQVRNATGKLAYFIGIDKIDPVPLQPIVARFILDLNLPAELNTLVNNLIQIEPVSMQWDRKQLTVKRGKVTEGFSFSVPNYEGRAMSFIIVALKLLFGLDGITERYISTYVEKLSVTHCTGEKLFNWNEWVVHSNLKAEILSAYHPPFALRNWEKVIDVRNLYEYYNKIISRWHPPLASLRRPRGKDTIKEIFKSLNECSSSSPSLQNWPITSFPLTQSAQQFLSKGSYSDSVLLCDFRSTTLSYVYRAYIWMHKNVNKEEDDSENYYISESEELEFSFAHKYWVHHIFLADLSCYSLAALPQIFLWLLDITCHSVEVKPAELFAEIILVERILLKCGDLSKKYIELLKRKCW